MYSMRAFLLPFVLTFVFVAATSTRDVNGDGQDEVSEEEEVKLGEHLIIVSYSLVGLIGIAIWAERRHIPSSVAAIVVGSTLGLVMRLAGENSAPKTSAIHLLEYFNEEFFLYFLLPPIIFEAGFSLSRHHFFHNLATILIFAVVGTILTMLLIGSAALAAGAAGWFRSGTADALDFSSPKDAFLFGALISATDPVATLSIMGAFNVEPLMYTLVAGESVLNDAVAIVLVRILDELGPEAFSSPSALLVGLYMFVVVSLGSLLTGIAIAASSALLLKRVDLSHHASLELSLLLLIGYAAYPTAEALHCSGILALFACAVFMGQYHVHTLSTETAAAVGLVLKALAHLAETFVFMYMGLDLVAQRGAVDDLFDEDHGLAGVDESRSTRRFVAFAVVVVPAARAVVVPPLVCLANLWRGRKHSLSLNETIFLVFAGLRGAIAFALARNASSAHGRTLVAATTAVIVFTTFILGGLTRPMLGWLGMISLEPPGDGRAAGAGGAGDGSERRTRRDDGGEFGRRWERLDAKVFQPLFGAPAGALQRLHQLPMQMQPGLRRATDGAILPPRDDGDEREMRIELEPLSAHGPDGEEALETT